MGNPSQTQNLQSLGSFKLANMLGFNGILATFKGFDSNTDLPAAIVAIHESDVVGRDCWAALSREMDTLMASSASRLCQPMSYGHDKGHYWAAYEWMKGSHIGIVVRDHGLPDSAQAFEWMSEVAECLADLQRKVSAHRIISPASIFINDFGQAKLLHACWGRVVLASRTGLIDPAMGSILPFVAPEVAAGNLGEEAADVFSLGANLYYLLTGQPIFWDDDPATLAQMIQSQRPDFSPLNGRVPPGAIELLDEMLSMNPEDRPVNLPALAGRLAAMARAIVENPQSMQPDSAAQVQPETGAAGSAASADQMALPQYSRYTETVEVPTAAAAPAQQTIGDIIRERHGEMEPMAAAPVEGATMPPPPKVQPLNKKLIIGIAAGVLILVVLAAGAVVGLGLMGGAEDKEEAAAPAKPKVTGPSPAELAEKYRAAADGLRRLAQYNKGFFRNNGRWPATADELRETVPEKELFNDAWGRPVDIRESFVFSAGLDGKWDNDDDLWHDAEENTPGGYRPTAPAAAAPAGNAKP